MKPHQLTALLALVFIYMARMLGLFLIFPVLALYADRLALPWPWMTASIIGLYGLSQALMQIPMGLLSDKYGRRPILLLGLFLLLLGSVIAAWGESGIAVFIGRLIQGSGAISAVTMAVVADLFDERQRIKVSAILGSSIGLSFVFAMFVSPLIATHYDDIYAVFWFSAALSLLALLAAFVIPRSPLLQSSSSPVSVAWTSWRDYRYSQAPVFISLCAGIFLVHAILSATFLSLPLWLTQSGFFPVHHGWLYALSLLLALPFVGYAVARARASLRGVESRQLPDSAKEPLCSAMVYLVVALAGMTLWLHFQLGAEYLIFCVVIFFYAFTVLESILPALCMQVAQLGNRGMTLGIFSASQFMGSFVGGIGAGLLKLLGGEILVLWVAVVLLVAWGIWLHSMPSQRD